MVGEMGTGLHEKCEKGEMGTGLREKCEKWGKMVGKNGDRPSNLRWEKKGTGLRIPSHSD
jgi:hypothetical protein